ncbi:hypothetical protein ACIP3A_14625 [Streptomyces tricolor]|uniref:hypothetical protein n=1 Tax=Streptomyces tricolor TaxID=68277 RepID=UPI00381E0225
MAISSSVRHAANRTPSSCTGAPAWVAYRAPIGLLDGTEALTDFPERFVGHMGRAEFRLRGHPPTHHARADRASEGFDPETAAHEPHAAV